MTDAEQLKPYPDCGTTCDCTADCLKMLEGMLRKVAKSASEGVAKNAGIAPQLAFAPILFALQDAVSSPNPSGDADVREVLAEARKWIAGQPDRSTSIYSTNFSMLEAIDLALTGNASTDRAGEAEKLKIAVEALSKIAFSRGVSENRNIAGVALAILNKDGGAG